MSIRVSLAKMGAKNPQWGKHRTEEEKRRLSVAVKERYRKNPEILQQLSEANTGHKNGQWKGDSVGYSALHDWVQRELGCPDTCEHCGRPGLSGQAIHWANKSGTYKRDLSDWIRLCVPCHSAYDRSKKKFPEPPNKTRIFMQCQRCEAMVKIKPHLIPTKKYCNDTCYKLARKGL